MPRKRRREPLAQTTTKSRVNASAQSSAKPRSVRSEARHHAQQRLLIRLIAFERADQPPVAQHEDPRRQRDELGQLARYQEDPGALRRQPPDQRVDFRLRADVDATGWFV